MAKLLREPVVSPDLLSRRFFRRVFGWFVSFAILLTLVLIGETLRQERDSLQSEFAIYERTFEKALAAALWAMDRDTLRSIVVGIVEIPDIERVQVFDPEGDEELLRVGKPPRSNGEGVGWVAHRFAIVHDEGFGREVVAQVEFHSSFARVVQRTQRQIALIVFLALLKTAALWWIFMVVGRQLIGRPLTEIADSIGSANSVERLRLSAETEKAIAGTELSVFRRAYDKLADHVHRAQADLVHANEELEERVRARTLALERANRQLDQLAHTDPLTGLANRRHFLVAAGEALARARRGQRPLALIVCDLDEFKQVNDLHGHAGGDRAILHVADCLRQSVREGDVAARLGGDEFAVLLPDTDLEQADTVASRLLVMVRDSTFALESEARHGVTLSIGVAALEPGDTRFDQVVQRADRRLYAAKRAGRDQVVSHDERSNPTVR